MYLRESDSHSSPTRKVGVCLKTRSVHGSQGKSEYNELNREKNFFFVCQMIYGSSDTDKSFKKMYFLMNIICSVKDLYRRNGEILYLFN